MTGMGTRINTIMQTCFFAISGVLPREEAIAKIKKAIEKTYGKRGSEVVRRNFEAVDQTLARLHEILCPARRAPPSRPPLVSEKAPDFLQKVTAVMMASKGDLLPVSAFPVDGTWPVATGKWEKRAIAFEIPVWEHEDLHPVQHVCAGLSSRGDPRQGLRPRRAWQCSGNIHVDALQRCRFQEQSLHDPGRARGLHGL